MKQILYLLALLSVCQFAYGYDFSKTIPSGQTLYFNILTDPAQGVINGVGTVEVVHPLNDYPYYNNSQKPVGNIVIPSQVIAYGNTYNVVQIAQSAFRNCSGITTVTFPTTVHTIWGSAFSHCTNLQEIIIPDGCAVSIRSSAFSYCDSLSTISFGSMVDTLYSNVFDGSNNITTINLNSEHLRNSYAQFSNARVKTVNIGASVKYIPKSLFENCDSLVSVIIPDSVTIIRSNAFAGCDKLSVVSLGSRLTNIGSSAFSGTAIQRVYLSDNIRKIGSYAFSNCSSLRYVHTGNNRDSIPYGIFSDCIHLDTLITCCTYIENMAFNNCDSIRTIIYNARKKYNNPSGNPFFSNRIPSPNNVKTLIIGDSVHTISHGMFGNLGITRLELGNSVKIIEYNAFYNCHDLTTVTIPEQIDTLHEGAFWNDSSLRKVIFMVPRCKIYKPYSSSIDQTPASVFPQCPIDTVIFTEGVREISDGLMRGRNLNYVLFPDSLETIGRYAFEGSGISIFPGMVSSLGDYSFANCTNLVDSLIISDNILSIGEGTFSGCGNLPSVSLYNTMTTIPDKLFENCSGITNQLILPQSLTHIGRCAFRNCGITGGLTIPGTIVNIGDSAFAGCGNLTDTLVIPYALTNIGAGVFKRCSQIPDVVFHTHVTQIKSEAFMGCSNLRRVYVPKLFTPTNLGIGIGKAAFARCEKLALVDIRRDAGINCYAFADCDSLAVARFDGAVFGADPGLYTYGGNHYYPGRQFLNCSNLRRVRIVAKAHNAGTVLFPSIFVGCTSFDTLILSGESVTRWQNMNNDTIGHIINVIVPSCNRNYMDSLIGFDDPSKFNLAWSVLVDQSFFDAGFEYYSCSSSDTLAGLVDVAENPNERCGVQITAMPKPGYVFSGWDDGSKMNPHMVYGLASSTAYFTFAKYLTVFSADTNRGIAIGSDSVEVSSFRYISAIPKTGYHFSHWDDGNTDNPRSVHVIQDMQFYAYFAPNDTITEYMYIHDTTLVNVQIHDTTYIDVTYAIHDTTYVDIHDTTFINVPYAVHDTTLIDVHDTIFIDVPYAVHDTTVVTDTVTLTEYVPVHDTTYINVPIHDTTYITQTDTVTVTEYVPVHDTTYITQIDTVIMTQYDTITNTIFDTLTVTDTLWLTQTDTLWMHDTIIIHDTIYIPQEGIDGVDALNAKVYSSQGQIVVEGADGNTVWLYDINGRVLATKQDDYTPLRFDAPVSGTYIIKIGLFPARKVVVIR